MTWRTHLAIVALRTAARKLGVARQLGRMILSETYEDESRKALLASVFPGDCVWDVGANVGLYTRLFSQRVGPSGHVFAFEPDPVCFEQLCANTTPLGNVTCIPTALGHFDGRALLRGGADPVRATSHAADVRTTPQPGDVAVAVCRGDELVLSGTVPPPNAAKIDTEGIEVEVLLGLSKSLGDSRVRAVGVEVHFGVLHARGRALGPREVERLLQGNGFACRWCDPSHIVAVRVQP